MKQGNAQLSSQNTQNSHLSDRCLSLKGKKTIFTSYLAHSVPTKQGATLTRRLLLLAALFASLLRFLAEEMLGLHRLLQARHEPLHVVKAVVHHFLGRKNYWFLFCFFISCMMRTRFGQNVMESCGQKILKTEVLTYHSAQNQPTQPLPGPASGLVGTHTHRHAPWSLLRGSADTFAGAWLTHGPVSHPRAPPRPLIRLRLFDAKLSTPSWSLFIDIYFLFILKFYRLKTSI